MNLLVKLALVRWQAQGCWSLTLQEPLRTKLRVTPVRVREPWHGQTSSLPVLVQSLEKQTSEEKGGASEDGIGWSG